MYVDHEIYVSSGTDGLAGMQCEGLPSSLIHKVHKIGDKYC